MEQKSRRVQYDFQVLTLVTKPRKSTPGLQSPRVKRWPRSYFPSEPPCDFGAEEHATPLPAGMRSGCSVNTKPSSSAPVLSLRDRASPKAQTVKKVCEGKGKTSPVTAADRTAHAVTLVILHLAMKLQ